MVSTKTLKIGAAGLAVAAIAIGLVGLSLNKGPKNKEVSASQAMGYDQCRRLIDGRYASPTNDVFEGKTRNLQWNSDGHGGYTGGNAAAGGGSKSGSKGGSAHSLHGSSKSSSKSKGGSGHSLHGSSKSGGSHLHHGSKNSHLHAKGGSVKVHSAGSKGSYAYCSKGSSNGSYYDPCGES
jgi:hypothetical protein